MLHSYDSLNGQYNFHSFSDEREDVQKKTFTKWVNSQLLKVNKRLFCKHKLENEEIGMCFF